MTTHDTDANDDETKLEQLRKRIQYAAQNDSFREDDLRDSVCYVLDDNGVEYETEYAIGSSDAGRPRYCDIYIPATDTAIELKLTANLRGVGQCVYYSRYCREAILLADGDPPSAGHNSAAMRAAEVAAGVKYALCLPNLGTQPAEMEIRTNSKAEFLFQSAYGHVGDRDFLQIKALGEALDYNGPGAAIEESPINHRISHFDDESEEVVRNE